MFVHTFQYMYSLFVIQLINIYQIFIISAMDGVCDLVIEYLAVREGLLTQYLHATPFTCKTLASSSSTQKSNNSLLVPPSSDSSTSRRSSLTDALQWFMKPMATASNNTALSRDINVLTPQSTWNERRTEFLWWKSLKNCCN